MKNLRAKPLQVLGLLKNMAGVSVWLARENRRSPQDQWTPGDLTLRAINSLCSFFLFKDNVLCWADLDKLIKISEREYYAHLTTKEAEVLRS